MDLCICAGFIVFLGCKKLFPVSQNDYPCIDKYFFPSENKIHKDLKGRRVQTKGVITFYFGLA